MNQTGHSDSFNDVTRHLSLDISPEDARDLGVKVNLMNDTDPTTIGDHDELNNDDTQLRSRNIGGRRDHEAGPDRKNSQANSRGVSPLQDATKTKQENPIVFEEDSKQAEKMLSQQDKEQQSHTRSEGDQGTTRSTINTLTSGSQVTKVQDSAYVDFGIPQNEQDENIIILAPEKLLTCDQNTLDKNQTVEEQEKKMESNVCQKSKKIYKLTYSRPTKHGKSKKENNKHRESQSSSEPYYHNPFYASETIDSLPAPGLPQNEGIEQEDKDRIEIEEKESEQREGVESRLVEDPKNSIPNPENQEFPTILTNTSIDKVQVIKDQIPEEEVPLLARNQQRETYVSEACPQVLTSQDPQRTEIHKKSKNIKRKESKLHRESKTIQKKERKRTKREPTKERKRGNTETKHDEFSCKAAGKKSRFLQSIQSLKESFEAEPIKEFSEMTEANHHETQSKIMYHFEEVKTDSGPRESYPNIHKDMSTPETTGSITTEALTPNSDQPSSQKKTKRKGSKKSEKPKPLLKYRRRSYHDRFQKLPFALTEIFDILHDPVKMKAFKCLIYQHHGKAFEHHLMIKTFNVLFRLEWAHRRLNQRSTESDLVNLHKYGIDQEMIQDFLSFKGFESLPKDECEKNGFNEEYYDDYLAYETFMRLFKIKWREQEIKPAAILTYLGEGINGEKPDGVRRNQVKIRKIEEVRKLLHPQTPESEEVLRTKAGARLAFEIYFKAGPSQYAIDLFVVKKPEIYQEFLL